MTRFKEELRKAGIKLECDYEALPDPSGIQAVTVDPEKAQFGVHHTSISILYRMTRSGSIEEVAAW